MYATPEATARYAARRPEYQAAGFYRTVFGLSVSSLGIGTYLGAATDSADRAYTEALIAAALAHLQREETVVCTKAGFLTPGAVGNMHSLAPRFRTRCEFEGRIRRAFAQMERLVDHQKIRWHVAATWDRFRKKDARGRRRAPLPHHPTPVQSVEEGSRRWPTRERSSAAERLGITAGANAARAILPGLATDAQRAIPFPRATPGMAVALVGMGRRAQVLDNLGVARVRPATREEYPRLYR